MEKKDKQRLKQNIQEIETKLKDYLEQKKYLEWDLEIMILIREELEKIHNEEQRYIIHLEVIQSSYA
ncbi:hypothetical protein [Candidatus Protochlamydia sp. R18]|uniref:hypothetical protein n=1 Tax=Candidatus Protochlamydia sp. R18 TaxID=1353977 RepID=UPI0005AB5B66|nr:hypothetical protein [Candidatus Protochlamydia sp. R18]